MHEYLLAIALFGLEVSEDMTEQDWVDEYMKRWEARNFADGILDEEHYTGDPNDPLYAYWDEEWDDDMLMRQLDAEDSDEETGDPTFDLKSEWEEFINGPPA